MRAMLAFLVSPLWISKCVEQHDEDSLGQFGLDGKEVLCQGHAQGDRRAARPKWKFRCCLPRSGYRACDRVHASGHERGDWHLNFLCRGPTLTL